MKTTGYPNVDPWVVDWFEQNGSMMDPPPEGFSAEYLAAVRPTTDVFPVTIPIAKVTQDTITGVPVRVYEHEADPTGVVVYVHGGGYVTGSIALMDPIAREIAAASGAAVVSVEYRLAPEHPHPDGLDDLEAVTRWVVEHAEERFGVVPSKVAVAGESAGGNLSAALALRLRNTGGPSLAAQVLLYPALDVLDAKYTSRMDYDGLVISTEYSEQVAAMRSGGRDLRTDEYAYPMIANDLSGLPPAFVMVGECDWLRDEGLAFAQRLRDAGVLTEQINCVGQPHTFVDLCFPPLQMSTPALGPWLRERFAAS